MLPLCSLLIPVVLRKARLVCRYPQHVTTSRWRCAVINTFHFLVLKSQSHCWIRQIYKWSIFAVFSDADENAQSLRSLCIWIAMGLIIKYFWLERSFKSLKLFDYLGPRDLFRILIFVGIIAKSRRNFTLPEGRWRRLSCQVRWPVVL
jgi:hypothetical protein